MPGDASPSSFSWASLHASVRDFRRNLAPLVALASRAPAAPHLKVVDEERTRLYYMCGVPRVRATTLFQLNLQSTIESSSSRLLDATPVLDADFHYRFLSALQSESESSSLSKEEQLLCERKRAFAPSNGITDFCLGANNVLLFSMGKKHFLCNVDDSSKSQPIEVQFERGRETRLNITLCPSNDDLAVFVSDSELWMVHLPTGRESRLTFVSDQPGLVSTGIPSFVMQEEFHRHDAFWFRPKSINNENVVSAERHYCLAYEEVDESCVEAIKLPQADVSAPMESFPFPRAGGNNARSTIRLVEFDLDNDNRACNLRHGQLCPELNTVFTDLEYVVRVGWHPSGQSLWVQLLDRRQRRLRLVLLPYSAFFSSSANFVVLLTQASNTWVTVNNALTFVPNHQVSNEVHRFVWLSEETGWPHLYMYTVRVDTDISSGESSASVLEKVELTRGAGLSVLDEPIFVDTSRSLVFFHAMESTKEPLEKHFYVVSWLQPGFIRRLTKIGFSHSARMDERCQYCLSVMSNLDTPSCSQLLKVVDNDEQDDKVTRKRGQLVTLLPLGWIQEPKEAPATYKKPELLTQCLSDGVELHAMLYRPTFMQEGRKYPVILSVYGGPEMPVVTNSFKGLRQMRSHLLASQGYVVVQIDGRGTSCRGERFERHLHCRMGQVELNDQLEVLHSLSHKHSFMDMSRVGIHGWSYGGYLSLMALIKHPDVFKVAVAGAPVTCWSQYDTGYTERYMDLPWANVEGYKQGSIVAQAQNFPDQPNRLLIAHGLMDENVHFHNHTGALISHLVKFGKPYQLQVYPQERHSLRGLDASEHFETTMLAFLKANL